MKKLIVCGLVLAWAAIAVAQINIVDTGVNFEVYTSGTYRSTHPKGLCYVNIDASGRVGILRSSNGSQVTTYSNVSAYRVNGFQYSTLMALVTAMQGAIFRQSCGGQQSCEYVVEGIDLFARCFTITFPEDLEFGENGFGFFSVQASQFSFSNSPTLVNTESEIGVTVSFFPSIQELLDALEANFISQVFWNESNPDVFTFERLPFGFKMCYTGEDFNSTITINFLGDHNQGLNPYYLEFGGDVFVLENLPDLTKDVQFEANKADNTFQIFQNGVWVNATPSDGTYTSTTAFTQWRIIDSEENVIESGVPQINCN